MNFNVYLDDDTARRLAALARRERVPRNALVRRAVSALIERENAGWPSAVFAQPGEPELPPFESHRAELLPAADDPLAAPRRRRPRPSGAKPGARRR